MKNSVKIIEVGPRDGLQNEKLLVPSELKIKFIRLLIQAGIKELEITSFVSPKVIPQLADAKDVLEGIKDVRDVEISVLIPNLNGLKRALDTSFTKAVFFVAASESFNQKNLNSSIENSLSQFKNMKKICDEKGIKIKASLSTAFECPFEGAIEPEKVAKVVDKIKNIGIEEITLCDTMGVVAPPEVEKLLTYLEKRFDIKSFGLHIHNTMGCAIASVYKGYEMGIRKFESSAGGLGGCPNSPGAAGNLSTEDVVYLFHRAGVETGINLTNLIKASKFIESLLNKNLTSRVLCYKSNLVENP